MLCTGSCGHDLSVFFIFAVGCEVSSACGVGLLLCLLLQKCSFEARVLLACQKSCGLPASCGHLAARSMDFEAATGLTSGKSPKQLGLSGAGPELH